MKKTLIIFFLLFVSFNIYGQNKIQKNKNIDKNSIGNKIYLTNTPEDINIKEISLPQDFIKLNKQWWINILFIFAFAVFTFFVLKFYTEILIITKAFINKAIFRQILSQKNSIYNNLFSFFNISTFILISILIFSFFSKFKNLSENYLNFVHLISIFGLVVGFYFLIVIFSKIWSLLFNEKNIFKLYITNIKISNIILFIILLFSLFIIFFNTNCNIFCYKAFFLIFLIVYSIRTLNLVRDFFEYEFSLFYLILYLCTVEIFPGLIMYKTFFD